MGIDPTTKVGSCFQAEESMSRHEPRRVTEDHQGMTRPTNRDSPPLSTEMFWYVMVQWCCQSLWSPTWLFSLTQNRLRRPAPYVPCLLHIGSGCPPSLPAALLAALCVSRWQSPSLAASNLLSGIPIKELTAAPVTCEVPHFACPGTLEGRA